MFLLEQIVVLSRFQVSFKQFNVRSLDEHDKGEEIRTTDDWQTLKEKNENMSNS